MSWFKKKVLLKVGEAAVKLSITGVNIKVNWVNQYLGDAVDPFSIIISPSRPNGVYAGKVDVDEMLKLVAKVKDKDLRESNKKYYETLKKRGVDRIGFFVLLVEGNATSWHISTDIIDLLKRPVDFKARTEAMSGFLKAFCLKNINRVITQQAFIVFKDNYDLKGSGKTGPKHFFLKWSEKAAKKQRRIINKEFLEKKTILDFV
jgi:hypothetical protein